MTSEDWASYEEGPVWSIWLIWESDSLTPKSWNPDSSADLTPQQIWLLSRSDSLIPCRFDSLTSTEIWLLVKWTPWLFAKSAISPVKEWDLHRRQSDSSSDQTVTPQGCESLYLNIYCLKAYLSIKSHSPGQTTFSNSNAYRHNTVMV